MSSKQTNHFWSLHLSVEESIDEQEIENAKKKKKHDFALFHEFLAMKDETIQIGELTAQELNKYLREFLLIVRKKKKNTQRGIRP